MSSPNTLCFCSDAYSAHRAVCHWGHFGLAFASSRVKGSGSGSTWDSGVVSAYMLATSVLRFLSKGAQHLVAGAL